MLWLLMLAGAAAAQNQNQKQNLSCVEVPQGVVCGTLLLMPRHEHLEFTTFWYWVYAAVGVVLVVVMAFGNGLVLAYSSIDPLRIEVMLRSGRRRQAELLRRVVLQRNWMLVTLLLVIAVASEALPLVLGKIVGDLGAILVSVVAVMFFGELLPQSLCAAHGVVIGTWLAWPTLLTMWLVAPLSYPLSRMLNRLLGPDELRMYSRAELAHLVALHRQHGILGADEERMIVGTLTLATRTVGTCMRPMQRVMRLRADDAVGRPLYEQLRCWGFTRLPVIDDSAPPGVWATQNCVPRVAGVLHVHEALNAAEGTPVRRLRLAAERTVDINDTLLAALQQIRTDRGNMLTVYDRDGMLRGIVTLRDVLASLL